MRQALPARCEGVFMGGRENRPGNQEEDSMIEVYYAEDDETIGKSVKEYLEQQNCKVVVFDRIADVRKGVTRPFAYGRPAGLEYAGRARK